MEHIEIKTKRLILRPFRIEDIEAVFDYAGNFENTKYALCGMQTRDSCKEFIEAAMTDDKVYEFAIELAESGKLIGGVEVSTLGDGAAELGWMIHRDCWGRGLCIEAAEALLKFAFEALKMRRVIAHCDTRNIASWKIMEKIGMRREGCFIEGRPTYSYEPDVHGDEYSYAVLAKEYFGKKDK